MRFSSERGQGAVENMLVISVLTVAVVGASYVFMPMFNRGVNDLSQDVSSILGSGSIGGVGAGGPGITGGTANSDVGPGDGSGGDDGMMRVYRDEYTNEATPTRGPRRRDDLGAPFLG